MLRGACVPYQGMDGLSRDVCAWPWMATQLRLFRREVQEITEKEVKMNDSEEEDTTWKKPRLDHPLKHSLEQTFAKELKDKSRDNSVSSCAAFVKGISGSYLRSSVSLGSATQDNSYPAIRRTASMRRACARMGGKTSTMRGWTPPHLRRLLRAPTSKRLRARDQQPKTGTRSRRRTTGIMGTSARIWEEGKQEKMAGPLMMVADS